MRSHTFARLIENVLVSVVLHIGTNEGDRVKNLRAGISKINSLVGSVIAQSTVYETEPWGVKDQGNFLNMALSVETNLAPMQLLNTIKAIEVEVGRTLNERWGPRVLDIDIIFYGKEVINESNLIIPHPHMQNRNFVLIPLMEICGDYEHPLHKVTVEDLYVDSEDQCEVMITQDQL